MGEYECDENDRPLYPPRIITTEVLLHPFDDIVPRDLKAKKQESDKPKIKVKKNKALLSFADDEEAPGIKEGITQRHSCLSLIFCRVTRSMTPHTHLSADDTEAVKKKMVSAHDVLDDARLSKEALKLPSRSKEELEADERAAREAAGKWPCVMYLRNFHIQTQLGVVYPSPVCTELMLHRSVGDVFHLLCIIMHAPDKPP
jgi:hypothetical protein